MRPHLRGLFLIVFVILVLHLRASDDPPAAQGKQNPNGDSPTRTDRYGDPLPTGALLRLGTVRWRTGAGFRMSSVLGKDGRSMFVSYGEAVRVFNLDTGELVRTIKGHEGGISCLALSPDGQTLASAGHKGAVLWDAASGKQLRPLKVSAVSVMAFSPDGKKLITGGEDHERSVRIFDVESGKEQLRMLWHQRQVTYVAVAPDGKTLVTAGWDRKVQIADMTTGEVIHTLQPPDSHDTVVALSPDGKTLAVADTRYQSRQPRWLPTLRLVDVATGRELRALHLEGQRTQGLIFSPDGKTLVSSGHKDSRIWDVRTGTEKRVSSSDKGFRVWDVATGAEIRHFPGGGVRLHISPDGKRLSAVGSVIRVWDMESGKELHPPEGLIGSVGSVAFAPDGKTLAACSFEDRGVIVLWDSTTGQMLRTLRGHEGYIRSVQFTPDGKLVSGGGDSTLRVWDPEAGKEVFQFKLHEPRAGEERLQVLSMSVSRDGKCLSASCLGFGGPGDKENTRLFVWNLANGKLLGQSEEKGAFGDFPAFSPDGKSLLQRAGRDLVLKDILTGKELLKLQPVPQEGGPGVLNPDILESPFAFSPDGRLVAVRSSRQRQDGPRYWRDNYAIRLFDAQTGKELHRIPIEGWRGNLAFSPDSKRLAGLGEYTIRIWDTATAKELWHSPDLDSRVTALAFSADGARLASGLDNTTILIWDVSSTK